MLEPEKRTSAFRLAGVILTLLLGAMGLWWLRDAAPIFRLLAASVGMIGTIKIAALLRGGARLRPAALFAFFLWPGVTSTGFAHRRPRVDPAAGSRFLESWLCFLGGTALLATAALVGRGESLVWDYVSLFAVFLIVHLGLVEVLADALRLLGFSPASLFDRPFLATSLRDFWSARWNLAFVDMNKIFLLRPLRGRLPQPVLTFAIFAVSGLLHELGISYADGVSWGKPLSYFLLQGLGMELERRRRLPRPLVWLWVLAPVGLLFPPAFVTLFLGGFGQWLARGVFAVTAGQWFSGGFLAGAALHLVVLCASVQVPARLGWREELRKLRTLNRKVFWTYGAYIFSIIIFMAAVSAELAREPVSGAALLWTTFIALFWWARVLADIFYMKPEDWPEGPLFRIGHVCLSTVFFALALVYSAELALECSKVMV